MERNICFDFGNTRLKYALFEEGEFKKLELLPDDSLAYVEKIIEQHKPEKSILSSVINHNPAIELFLSETTRFHKLTHASKLPVTTPVGKPETIGADRLALVSAAVHLFPNQHNLVIGLGSCITFNFVNKLHQFLGGSISPGMEMRFKAMHENTAKLPLVAANSIFPLIGYDTKTNLLSGVILGISCEIDGLIELYAKKYDNFNVLLTGGDMGFFVPHLKNKIFADPFLIYKGLNAINEINN